MKREITRLDVMSVAVMYGASLALLGLFFALLFFIFGSMFGAMMGRTSMGGLMGGGFITLILFPLLYGALGLILGPFLRSFITCWPHGLAVSRCLSATRWIDFLLR